MLTGTRIAAAAPTWVRERLGGPLRSAPIVHSGANAIYLESRGDCIGVLGSAAVAVPCGLHTTLGTLTELLADAEYAVLGKGRLTIGAADIRITRFTNAGVPKIEPSPSAIRTLLELSGDALDDVREELPSAALRTLRAADCMAVPGLLGRGSGLTPVGDDVLCGWLATSRSIGARSGALAATVIALADDSTTALSATLLRRARAGDVIPEFRRLLHALGDASTPDDSTSSALRAAITDLLAVGHTSGAGLLLGCTLALPAAATPPASPRGTSR